MKRVLVAALNWGLGHASRSIPLIDTLIEMEYEVIIASDGAAGELLIREYPDLTYIELPAYDIRQPVSASYLHWFRQYFKIRKAVAAEWREVQDIITKHRIQYIISDNRYGVYHAKTPCYLVTHQLRLATPWPTNIIPNQIIKKWIEKFDACWIPDFSPPHAIAHDLHAGSSISIPLEYMGLQSRLYHEDLPHIYDFAVIISGPEPGRTFFEKALRNALTGIPCSQVWVLGKPVDKPEVNAQSNWHHYQPSEGINDIFNQTKIIIARAGYSTIMDCLKLKKKAILVITSGQPEQRYLANFLRKYSCFRVISESEISNIPHLIGDLSERNVQFPLMPTLDLRAFLRRGLG